MKDGWNRGIFGQKVIRWKAVILSAIVFLGLLSLTRDLLRQSLINHVNCSWAQDRWLFSWVITHGVCHGSCGRCSSSVRAAQQPWIERAKVGGL